MKKNSPGMNITGSSPNHPEPSESPSPFGSFKTTLNPSATIHDPDNVIQAVILADSFNERFLPITLENPRCLLPLANIPLIEYTFEFLAVAGVQEIFVFCCAHHEKIAQYLKESKWTQTHSSVRVHTIISQNSMGVGDAMREIDSQSIIRGDFILLSGDIVANMKLSEALEEHKARRVKDKNIIMTMVLKEANPHQRIKAVQEPAVMVFDKETMELIKYDIGSTEKNIELDMEIVKAHPVIQYRTDLLDCEIDICTPEVLALFSENFDYQHMRKHFVKGTLESDILGKKIMSHIISDQYAARVGSIPSYDVVSQDVIKRWTFPLVPDNNFFGNSKFSYSRHHIYKEEDVVLARSCIVQANTVIGRGSKIGENTTIINSVIGEGCVIGSGVTLKGAYLWKRVTIGNDCKITGSVLCDNVNVHRGVVINEGCILSYGVEVGPNFTLKPRTRLSLRKPVESESDDDDVLEDDETLTSTIAFSEEVVGKQGRGYLWTKEESEDSENQGLQLFLGEIEAVEDEISSDSENEEDQVLESDVERFHREAVETVKRSIEEKHSLDNTALEINGLKFAYNSSFRDCIYAVICAMFDLVDPANPAASIKKIVGTWSKLISKFAQNPEDQYETVILIQEFSASHDLVTKYFSPILQILYQSDVLEEDAIMKWYNSSESSPALKTKAQSFINWLNEAEEEDDDE